MQVGPHLHVIKQHFSSQYRVGLTCMLYPTSDTNVDGREMNSNHIYTCVIIKQKYTAQNGKDNINVIEHSHNHGCLSGLKPVSDWLLATAYWQLFCSTADPDVMWPDRSSKGRQPKNHILI